MFQYLVPSWWNCLERLMLLLKGCPIFIVFTSQIQDCFLVPGITYLAKIEREMSAWFCLYIGIVKAFVKIIFRLKKDNESEFVDFAILVKKGKRRDLGVDVWPVRHVTHCNHWIKS